MLRRPHYIASALVAVLILILLNLPAQTTAKLKLGIGSVFLPLFGVSGSTRELAGRSVDTLVPRGELLRQRDSALRENQELRLLIQRLEPLEQENARLRELLGWQRSQRATLKPARVIGREPSNWWRTVQIDIGSRQGVRENLPVLTPQGLAGRISSVSPTFSQVVLLGDPNCKVAARVDNPGRDGGIIGPAGPLERDLVELSYVSRSADLKPGQMVRTSGDGGVFPRDIPIGTIVDSHPVEYGLYTVARVKVAANLGALDEVFVLFTGGVPTTGAKPGGTTP
jgi:rod shape-determining protein MreC